MSSKAQDEIAERLGIDVTEDSFRVAAAKILDAVSIAVISKYREAFPTDAQSEFALSLRIDPTNKSKRVLSALITDELEKRNAESIKEHDLKCGDMVIRKSDGKKFQISSIGTNYRLWFKGGNGSSAWPTQVQRIQQDEDFLKRQ